MCGSREAGGRNQGSRHGAVDPTENIHVHEISLVQESNWIGAYAKKTTRKKVKLRGHPKKGVSPLEHLKQSNTTSQRC